MSEENQLDPVTERFKNIFMDVLAEVELDNQKENTKIVDGLVLAFDEWIDYHGGMAKELERLRIEFLRRITVG